MIRIDPIRPHSSPHQRAIKQSVVFERAWSVLFTTNFVLGDAGISAWLPVDAVRFLRLGGSVAETGLTNYFRASPLIPLA
jgi:hypothetical protein